MFLAAVISFKDTSCKSYFPAQRREWTFKASLPPPERRKTLVGNLRDFFFFFLPVCRRRTKSLWESFGFSGFWQKKKKKEERILFSFLFSCSFFFPQELTATCRCTMWRIQVFCCCPPPPETRFFSAQTTNRVFSFVGLSSTPRPVVTC